MSPSESDLRAALREGEGDRLDPDDIILSVRHVRARRRNMLLSAAAAVVVVGGTASGVTALVNSGKSPTRPASAGAPQSANAAGPNRIGSNSANVPASKAPHSLGTMPGVQIIPSCRPFKSLGGQTPPGPPPSGSLVSGPVKEFFVCAYSIAGPEPSAVPQPVVVSGLAARQLLHSLQNLPATSAPRDCPKIASTRGTAVRIIPITPSGRQLPAITANIGRLACDTVVTNGSAVRYGWQLPPHVAALLRLQPGSFGLSPLPNQPGTAPR